MEGGARMSPLYIYIYVYTYIHTTYIPHSLISRYCGFMCDAVISVHILYLLSLILLKWGYFDAVTLKWGELDVVTLKWGQLGVVKMGLA